MRQELREKTTNRESLSQKYNLKGYDLLSLIVRGIYFEQLILFFKAGLHLKAFEQKKSKLVFNLDFLCNL